MCAERQAPKSAPESPFPKGRLEALTDGIFAVAMTLLVLDLRLPENLSVHGQADLITALEGLGDKVVPYLLSFYVLGTNWLSLSRMQSRLPHASAAHARWTLVYLLLVTVLPFTTVIIGRFASYPVASWLYLANIALMAGIFHELLPAPDAAMPEPDLSARRLGLRILIGSCLLSAALCPIFGGRALLALLLNVVLPPLFKLRRTTPH
jgi:uncharacterized membrane protein